MALWQCSPRMVCVKRLVRVKGQVRVKKALFICLFALWVAVLSGCGLNRFVGLSDPFGSSGVVLSSHKIVRTAQTQIGARYRFGGSSPSAGFDCSGLIWWSFRQNGIKVPRVTTDQAAMGKRVSTPQPGDVLVFRISRSGTGLHTALYAGNGQFVHSPSSGKRVCMESLSDSYWGPRLIGIRRR